MKNIQHILQLPIEDKRKFFDSFDLIFFDCDGVIWLVAGFIPNTAKAINLLKDAGKDCKFVSNNSMRSEQEYLEKFKIIGVRDVISDDITFPAKSITRYIKAHYPQNASFFSICSDTANDYFREKGLNIETMNVTENLNPVTFTEKIDLVGKRVKAVLFDINLNLRFSQLARAALYLQQDDCDLIAGAADPHIPMSGEITTIGFNYFEQQLIEQHQRENIKLGKPGMALGKILLNTYNIKDPKRVLFIGDSLKQDIGFGKKTGFQTLLVLTGTTSLQDMLAASAEFRPDYYADSILDFISFIKDVKAA